MIPARIDHIAIWCDAIAMLSHIGDDDTCEDELVILFAEHWAHALHVVQCEVESLSPKARTRFIDKVCGELLAVGQCSTFAITCVDDVRALVK